jgi:parallel beta helix pectate lyase-like protein
MRPPSWYTVLALLGTMVFLNTGCGTRSGSQLASRVISVAQAAPADVIGRDSESLQKAANLLHPGDVLSIGAGTYTMENSLFVPSGVTVRGVAGKTILRKARGVESPLVEDADYGDTFLAVADPEKFHPGMGVAIVDDTLKAGWDISISSIASVQPPYVIVNPMTVRDYDRQKQHARMTNTYPILCAIDAANVVLEDLIVDGNRAENHYIDGCRGGAIYMYRVRNVTVRRCTARNYNGDGISFQISDGVHVIDSESYGHAGYGVHPGTGSVSSLVKDCRLRDNGDIGLFLCWRVRHGRFENNVIENNGHYGISIGHKDTDNEFVGNTVAHNGLTGVYFRKETAENSGSRNVFRNNKVLDNGNAREGYGFYIEPYATDLVIESNQIADTRAEKRTQRYGIYKAPGAGSIEASNNWMSGHSARDFHESALRADVRH